MLQLIIEIFFAMVIVFGLYILQRKLFSKARRMLSKDEKESGEDE